MAKILFATTAEGVKFYPVTITDAVVHIKDGEQKKLTDVLDDLQGAAATAQAAAEATAAADASAKDTALEEKLVGDADTDTSASNTIAGAKKYADEKLGTLAGALQYKGTVNANADLPSALTANDKGAVYVVKTAGTYVGQALEVGDYLIWDGAAWDALNGENQVENEAASLEIGTAKKVATVDGTEITITQVEDMTKIEAVAVADTTDYADVTALFTAPVGD